MKTLLARGFMWLMACVSASFLVSGCHEAKYVRRTTSDADKQAQLNWNYQTSVEVYQKSKYKSFRWNDHAVAALVEFAAFHSGIFASNEPCGDIIASNAADYAHDAYLSGQWNEFLHQTTLFFSGGTNYDTFGGKEAFDQMVETAKQNAGK